MRPDSGTGVMISTKERREVLGRIRGGGKALPRRSGGNAGGGESRCLQLGCCGPPIDSVGRNKIRRKMRRQRSVMDGGLEGERYQQGQGGVCWRRPIPKAERAMAKKKKGGGKRVRRIVLMQRKVGNLGNL